MLTAENVGTSNHIKAMLSDLPGVSRVDVTEDEGGFRVSVVMSRFDRDSRRRVYAAEGKLFDELRDTSLEIHLIDASASGLANDALLEG